MTLKSVIFRALYLLLFSASVMLRGPVGILEEREIADRFREAVGGN